jgi:hypothetical protein
MSHFRGVKTNNAKITAKEKLRVIQGINNLSVLDIYCGAGEMYNAVWNKAKSYEGIDIKEFTDGRKLHIGDAPQILKKINIDKFDVFDIDAYGSPYECLLIILNKIKTRKIRHFIITDGIEIDLRMGNIEQFFGILTGVESRKINNIHKIHDQLILKLLKNIEHNLNTKVSNFLIAKGKTGSGMRYYRFTINDAV